MNRLRSNVTFKETNMSRTYGVRHLLATWLAGRKGKRYECIRLYFDVVVCYICLRAKDVSSMAQLGIRKFQLVRWMFHFRILNPKTQSQQVRSKLVMGCRASLEPKIHTPFDTSKRFVSKGLKNLAQHDTDRCFVQLQKKTFPKGFCTFHFSWHGHRRFLST